MSDEARQGNLVLSPSSITTYLKSPAKFEWQYVLGNKSEQTPAMFEGEVIHKAILEADTFDQAFVVMEDKYSFLNTIEEFKQEIANLGHKPAKGLRQDLIDQLLALNPEAKVWDTYFKALTASNRRVISPTQHKVCLDIQNKVARHSWLSKALQGGVAEQWAHFEFSKGIYLNMRMDYYNAAHKQPIVLDIKTTRSASFEGFQKEIWNQQMYVSAAIYCDAVEKITGKTPLFAWVVIEKEAPYPIEVYSADFGLLEAGRAVYRKTIGKICDSLNNNDFSYNQNKIINMNLPAWAFNKLDAYAESEIE